MERDVELKENHGSQYGKSTFEKWIIARRYVEELKAEAITSETAIEDLKAEVEFYKKKYADVLNESLNTPLDKKLKMSVDAKINKARQKVKEENKQLEGEVKRWRKNYDEIMAKYLLVTKFNDYKADILKGIGRLLFIERKEELHPTDLAEKKHILNTLGMIKVELES